MKTKIGNLAIANFGGENNTAVCIVTGKSEGHFNFFYWEKNEQGISIFVDKLSTNRLIRVQPIGNWDGDILKLTLNNVEPV